MGNAHPYRSPAALEEPEHRQPEGGSDDEPFVGVTLGIVGVLGFVVGVAADRSLQACVALLFLLGCAWTARDTHRNRSKALGSVPG